MNAMSCLLIKNGVIVLFTGKPETDDRDKDIKYELMEYGLLLKTAGLRIPLPEIVIKHLLDTGTILIYYQPENNFVATPLYSVNLDLKSLAEAKGEYNFASRQAAHELKTAMIAKESVGTA